MKEIPDNYFYLYISLLLKIIFFHMLSSICIFSLVNSLFISIVSLPIFFFLLNTIFLKHPALPPIKSLLLIFFPLRSSLVQLCKVGLPRVLCTSYKVLVILCTC